MAGKRVEREKRDVESKDKCADASSKAAVEEKGTERVAPQKHYEESGKVEEVAMDVLKDEGKGSLAAIIPARRFAHSAGGGIEEKRAVVGFAVVVARSAKTQRASKNQERR